MICQYFLPGFPIIKISETFKTKSDPETFEFLRIIVKIVLQMQEVHVIMVASENRDAANRTAYGGKELSAKA